MQNLLTKKSILISGLLGTIVIAIVVFLAMSDFCYNNGACMNFFRTVHPWDFVDYILFTPPLFLLSLITYKMREEVFAAWMKFTQWWIPLTFIAVLLTPRDSGGFISVAYKEVLSFFCAVLFLIISLILITYKSYKLRGK